MPHPHYEPGTYTVRITGQRFSETPTNTPFFAISFEPLSVQPPTKFPSNVYERDLTLYFSEKAAPYSIEKLRRIGWEGTSLTDLDSTVDGYTDLAGTVIEVVCRHNDKGYEEWDLTPPGGPEKAVTPGVASRLDKLFGKALKAKQAPRPKPEPKAKSVADLPVSDAGDTGLPF